MRPPVIIPLLEMITRGPSAALSCFDSCTVRQNRTSRGNRRLRPSSTSSLVEGMVVQVTGVDGRGVDGHRRVDDDGHLGQVAPVHEFAQDQRHLLDAAHGEGRDQHDAAPADGLGEDALDLVAHGRLVVQAVAVGRLDDQGVARDRAVRDRRAGERRSGRGRR